MSLPNYPLFKDFDPESIARKALIYANPLYLSLQSTEQADYRINRPEADDVKIVSYIEKAIADYMNNHLDDLPVFNQSGSFEFENEDEKEEYWLSEIAVFLKNWVNLLACSGVGVPFVFNELNAEKKDLLKKNFTLKDYHIGQVDIQQKLTEDEPFPEDKYKFFYWSAWVRLITDGKFYYGTICSVADYINCNVKDYAETIINKLIPHEFVEGENNNQKTDGGFTWDYRVDAGGKEKQLDELNNRWHKYQKIMTDAIDKKQEKLAPKVFIKTEFQNGTLVDPHITIIINNLKAGEMLTISRIMEDISMVESDFAEVEKLISRQNAKAKAFIEEQYQDIEENFDPTIVKFKKRMKVVIAPNTFDNLK